MEVFPKDEDIAHEIYHADAVLEFPQSDERFEGVENFREWRRQYPAKLDFKIRRITRRDDLVVAENLISYDGGPWMFTVNMMEFRGDRVAHERIYSMDGWELQSGELPGALLRQPTRQWTNRVSGLTPRPWQSFHSRMSRR